MFVVLKKREGSTPLPLLQEFVRADVRASAAAPDVCSCRTEQSETARSTPYRSGHRSAATQCALRSAFHSKTHAGASRKILRVSPLAAPATRSHIPAPAPAADKPAVSSDTPHSAFASPALRAAAAR